MRFPFIPRKDHDEQIRLLNLTLCSNMDTISAQKTTIGKLEAEIMQLTAANDSLVEELTAPKVEPHLKERKKPTEAMLRGRGGWKARAQAASQKTIKPEPDSAKMLEEKVKREGGTV